MARLRPPVHTKRPQGLTPIALVQDLNLPGTAIHPSHRGAVRQVHVQPIVSVPLPTHNLEQAHDHPRQRPKGHGSSGSTTPQERRSASADKLSLRHQGLAPLADRCRSRSWIIANPSADGAHRESPVAPGSPTTATPIRPRKRKKSTGELDRAQAQDRPPRRHKPALQMTSHRSQGSKCRAQRGGAGRTPPRGPSMSSPAGPRAVARPRPQGGKDQRWACRRGTEEQERSFGLTDEAGSG